jgi:hypothetical protein
MDDAVLVAMGGRLATAIAGELRGGRSKKWRCPAELKAQVLVYAGHCRERGEPLGDIAARLGLVESTVSRWLRRERGRSRATFRQVAIVAHEGGSWSAEPGGAPGTLRLITPRGYTVEGLEVEDLARLLQVVG